MTHLSLPMVYFVISVKSRLMKKPKKKFCMLSKTSVRLLLWRHLSTSSMTRMGPRMDTVIRTQVGTVLLLRGCPRDSSSQKKPRLTIGWPNL